MRFASFVSVVCAVLLFVLSLNSVIAGDLDAAVWRGCGAVVLMCLAAYTWPDRR